MPKNELRSQMLNMRKTFASQAISEMICENAAKLPIFTKAKNIMIYISTGSEVDTAALIKQCKKENKKIFAPRVLNHTDMEAAELDEKGLSEGRFHIWEPMGKTSDKIDLIFVPGVVFDKRGYRIGYGKGYYDRFLSRTDAVTIGLAYSFQVINKIPAEEHDICLDMILTEEGIIQ